MIRFAAAAGVIAVALVAAAAASQRVGFRAEDGTAIAATWYEPSQRSFDSAQGRPAPAVVLLHMLGRSRRDLEPLASRLASEGIGALAIDFRGHGDSGGSVHRGDGADYSQLILDVKAARRWLSTRGDVQPARIGVAGASLGANVAALYAASDATIVSLALLSPSLDYRGLRIEQALKQYGARPALLVASDDDPYARRSVRDLANTGQSRESVVLHQAGHGTHMLSRDGDLVRRLVDWFRRTL